MTKDLNSVFFAPNYNKMRPFMVEASKSFKYKSDATPEKILMRIIGKYYTEYNVGSKLAKADEWGGMDGDFNLSLMLKYCNEFCNKVRLANFFHQPDYYGVKNYANSTEQDNIFGKAQAYTCIKTHDHDCYQTAGGYRSYESNSDTPIVSLEYHHNGIYISVESSLIIDHYNNNFFGVSTGGGHRTYKKGENNCIRKINTGSFDLKSILKEHNLDLISLDLNNGKSLMNDYFDLN